MRNVMKAYKASREVDLRELRIDTKAVEMC